MSAYKVVASCYRCNQECYHLPTGGPDRTTRLKGTSFQSRVEFQADNAQLVRSTGVNVSVMVLQGRKSSPQKSRPPESGHRRHGVWIAIEYSYKLGQKKEFKFLCVPGCFSQIQSHIKYYLDHVISPDVGILGSSPLAYTGPILVHGSFSLYIK